MAVIYASTACTARVYPSLEHQLSAYDRAGIRNVELGHCPDLAGFDLASLRRSPGHRYLVHNYFPPPEKPLVLNLASQRADVLEATCQFYERAIQLSGELGAKVFSLHCGFLADFSADSLGKKLRYDTIYNYEAGYKTFVESLLRLLDVARTRSIKLLVEPNVVAPFNLVDGKNLLLMMATPAEFNRLLQEQALREIGILLDLGHLQVTANTLSFTTAEFVRTVSSHIGAFHAHENDGLADQHRPLTEGSWGLEVLKRVAYADLPVIVEASFMDAARLGDHCRWLESQLSQH